MPSRRRPMPRRAAKAFFRLAPIYLLVLPGLVLFLTWTLYPLVDAFIMSFFQWNPNPSGTSTFLGADNYGEALHDPIFWQAFGNVVWYTLGTVPAQMALGLGVAIMLNRKLAARGVFRVLFYLPVITSWVVVSFAFEFLFNSQGGLVDWFLGDVLHVTSDTQPWLGDLNLALPTLMIMGIWKGIGWNMVIFLAALQTVPREIYEAAAVDGAGALSQFRRITLPWLRPTIVFVSVILVIGAFGVFIPMFIMTGGGPEHATETLVTYGYTNAFSSGDFGYGAAVTYLFAAFVAVFAGIQLWLQWRKGDIS